jgi:hypothetical protein
MPHRVVIRFGGIAVSVERQTTGPQSVGRWAS